MLVGELLDRRRRDPGRPDPVAPHHDRALLAGLVEVGRTKRLGVARAELEDVADLDRRLDVDRAAQRAAVACLDLADVGEARRRSPAPARRRAGGSRLGSRRST